VPPSACANAPSRAETAPVKAPRSWPKNSLPASVGTTVVQSTTTNRPLSGRWSRSCTSRATSSLPVPLSPVSSTDDEVNRPTSMTSRSVPRQVWLCPTRWPRTSGESASSSIRAQRSSRAAMLAARPRAVPWEDVGRPQSEQLPGATVGQLLVGCGDREHPLPATSRRPANHLRQLRRESVEHQHHRPASSRGGCGTRRWWIPLVRRAAATSSTSSSSGVPTGQRRTVTGPVRAMPPPLRPLPSTSVQELAPLEPVARLRPCPATAGHANACLALHPLDAITGSRRCDPDRPRQRWRRGVPPHLDNG
jgi:hypothetical protein